MESAVSETNGSSLRREESESRASVKRILSENSCLRAAQPVSQQKRQLHRHHTDDPAPGPDEIHSLYQTHTGQYCGLSRWCCRAGEAILVAAVKGEG